MRKQYNFLQQTMLTLPHIELLGDMRCCVENYTRIMQYTEKHILIACHEGFVHIDGVDLVLSSLTEDCVQMEGKIVQVRYEEK